MGKLRQNHTPQGPFRLAINRSQAAPEAETGKIRPPLLPVTEKGTGRVPESWGEMEEIKLGVVMPKQRNKASLTGAHRSNQQVIQHRVRHAHRA